MTGSEIYNTHADFKDESKLLASLRSPTTMLALAPVLAQYPQETFAALEDYPADYLKRWDQLCRKARLTGVSANDAHHNQRFRARLLESGKVQLEEAFGKVLARLDPENLPPLKAAIGDKKPGDLVFELDFDPYERSFHHVSTHLLMHEVTEDNVREALQAGRAFVAFDWIADPTGFVLRTDRGTDSWPMGSVVPFSADLRLRAEAPLEGAFKLLRDGEIILEQNSNKIDVPVDKPGNYRVEVWLTLAGEARPWILSNPVYVRGQ
jgi:hypothetical protein